MGSGVCFPKFSCIKQADLWLFIASHTACLWCKTGFAGWGWAAGSLRFRIWDNGYLRLVLCGLSIGSQASVNRDPNSLFFPASELFLEKLLQSDMLHRKKAACVTSGCKYARCKQFGLRIEPEHLDCSFTVHHIPWLFVQF